MVNSLRILILLYKNFVYYFSQPVVLMVLLWLHSETCPERQSRRSPIPVRKDLHLHLNTTRLIIKDYLS